MSPQQSLPVFLGSSWLQPQGGVCSPGGAFLSCDGLLLGPTMGVSGWLCLQAWCRGGPRPGYSGLLSSWTPVSWSFCKYYSWGIWAQPLLPVAATTSWRTWRSPAVPISSPDWLCVSPDPQLLGWRTSYSNPCVDFRVEKSWSGALCGSAVRLLWPSGLCVLQA